MAEWMRVVGFEYEVSDDGAVRKLSSGKEISQRIESRYGEAVVTLYSLKKPYIRYVKRLVAQVFVPNPKMLPCVYHRDGDKTNNRPENLYWGEHDIGAAKSWSNDRSKPITVDGEEYRNMTLAAKAIGCAPSSVSAASADGRTTLGSTIGDGDSREARGRVKPNRVSGFSGSNLKFALRKRGITVAGFARSCGISETTMRRIASGSMLPTLDMAIKMAETLGVRLIDLCDKQTPASR